MRENLQHAWHGLGVGQINGGDLPARDRAGDEKSEGGIVNRDVGGIAGLPRHFQPRLQARYRLTHIGFWFGSGSVHDRNSWL